MSDRTVWLWDITTGHLRNIRRCDRSSAKASFSQDGSYLETDGERIPLGLSASVIHAPCQHLYGLDQGQEWVTWNSQNIIFLPYGQRTFDFAITDNILVIGHVSGRLTYFEFDPNIDPVPELLH